MNISLPTQDNHLPGLASGSDVGQANIAQNIAFSVPATSVHAIGAFANEVGRTPEVEAVSVPGSLPVLRAEIPGSDYKVIQQGLYEEKKAIRHLQHVYTSEQSKIRDEAEVLYSLLLRKDPLNPYLLELQKELEESRKLYIEEGIGSGSGDHYYRVNGTSAAAKSVRK